MARIPTRPNPQRTVSNTVDEPINPGDTRDAFGQPQARAAQAAGQAVSDVGQSLGQMAQAQNRLQAQDDALKRIQRINQTEAEVRELYLEAQTEGDLSDPDQVMALREKINERFNTAVQNFGYDGQRPENPILFGQEIARARGKWNASLTQAGIEAGRAAMDREMQTKVGELAGLVSSNPAAIADAQAELERFMDTNYAPAMTAEAEAAARQAGMETIATTAIDYYTSKGQYSQALEQLDSPLIQPHLSAGRARELRLRIYTGMGEADKLRAQAEARLGIIREAGVEITPEIAVAATTGVNISRSKTRTTADKILEFEQMMARVTGNKNFTASPEHVARFYAADARASDQPLNAGERFLVEMADEVRDGTASPEEFEQFVFLAGKMQQTNVATGVRTELPINVREALEARGISPRDLTTERGVEQLQSARQTLTGAPGATGAPAPQTQNLPAPAQERLSRVGQNADEMVAAAQGAEAGPDGQKNPGAVLDAIARTGITFFDQAELLTGALSGAAETASGMEVIGRVVSAPQTRQLRQAFTMIQPMLAYAFREGERYADAERQDLQTRLRAVQGSFFTSPQGLQDDMIGLDNLLSVVEAHYRDALEKEGELSRDRARDVTDRMNTIQLVRKVLGVPPLATTEDELHQIIRERGLKPGDKIRWKDGRVYSIKGAAPPEQNNGGE